VRIALCSDEPYPVHITLRRWLEERGHEVVPFGSVASGSETPFAIAAESAASAVVSGECDEGIFACWSGTGISIAANKLPGIRAALCTDPGQAAAARIWNHANVLCLSNRTLSDDMAKELLTAWFETNQGTQGQEAVNQLKALDTRHRR
jgi:ribose 5-phosphate isomerase B